jgi:hypothetical protein
MKVSRISLFIIVIFCLSYVKSDRFAKKKQDPTSKPKPKPIQLDTDGLPTLTEILEELNISDYLKNFIG